MGFSCQSFKKCYFRNKYKLKYLEYDLCSADMGIRANISLCKINNRNTRRRCEICSTSSKMVPEGRCRSDVFIFLAFNIFYTFFSCLYRWLCEGKCLLGFSLFTEIYRHVETPCFWNHFVSSY